eukprot:5582131-Amphidinium_carterae.1
MKRGASGALGKPEEYSVVVVRIPKYWAIRGNVATGGVVHPERVEVNASDVSRSSGYVYGSVRLRFYFLNALEATWFRFLTRHALGKNTVGPFGFGCGYIPGTSANDSSLVLDLITPLLGDEAHLKAGNARQLATVCRVQRSATRSVLPGSGPSTPTRLMSHKTPPERVPHVGAFKLF